jgi:hypothetical protein
LSPEPGAYYVMDRGFLDLGRLYHLHEAGSFFVTRAKSNLKAERRYSHPVDCTTGLICDQTVILSGFYAHKGYLACPHCGLLVRPDFHCSLREVWVLTDVLFFGNNSFVRLLRVLFSVISAAQLQWNVRSTFGFAALDGSQLSCSLDPAPLAAYESLFCARDSYPTADPVHGS